MKFNCGLSTEAKNKALRGKEKEIDALIASSDGLWHKKFAWLPVRLGENDCRWLEWYERQVFSCVVMDGKIHYSYANKFRSPSKG